jgi:hypothetical protein
MGAAVGFTTIERVSVSANTQMDVIRFTALPNEIMLKPKTTVVDWLSSSPVAALVQLA